MPHKRRIVKSQRPATDLFTAYMSDIAHAAMRHCVQEGGLYYGMEGCRRFARECGAAFLDFEREGLDPERLFGSTYSGICVIAYGLKPPVGARSWLEWIREGYRDAKAKEEPAAEEGAPE